MSSSSAGSATSLFGDGRTILLIELSKCSEEGVETIQAISDVNFKESPFAMLLQFLRAYDAPPETSIYYVQGVKAAQRELISRRTCRFTHICILSALSSTSKTQDDTAINNQLGTDSEIGLLNDRLVKLVNSISTMFPPVVSDRLRALKPVISMVEIGLGSRHIPGVDLQIYCQQEWREEDIVRITRQLTDQWTASTSLMMASTRTSVRTLEEVRLNRSAMVEPFWLVELVGHIFNPPTREAQSFPALPEDDERERLLQYINDWNFYAPSLSQTQLLQVIWLIFEQFELLEMLEVSRMQFQQFILVLEANYRDNPYHNFYHAVDVLQCCYHVLSTSLMMRRMFRHVDVFALFVAALGHDVGHGGFNNNFLVEHESLLAWLYNDRSVLENMHAAVLFALIRQPSLNFVTSWNRTTWRDFRQLVVAAILGTDMTHHFDYIRQLGGMDGALARSLKHLNSVGEGPVGPEDRRLVAIAIIKFADICNVVRPFTSARRWGFHLMCEFYHQGDWEKALGYQSTPMTTRSVGDLAKGQQYFLNNVAAPLYRCVTEHFSELYFVEEHLKVNLEQWRTWRPESDDLVHQYAELYPPSTAGSSSNKTPTTTLFERTERHHSH